MLLSLHVKNIAIIEEEEIEFGSGLNILSGETGAGKSIILGALGLAMGNKNPKGIIRDETKEALAEAVFSVNPGQKKRLTEMDIDCPEGEVILQRKITPQRASAKINGETVPAGKLSEVSAILLDIYGQHEQQTLLSRKNHLLLLDEYGGKGISEKLSAISGSYLEYKKLMAELESSSIDEMGRARETDLLSHEVSQIEAARLTVGEDESLRIEYDRLIHGEKISNCVGKSLELCEDSVSENLGRAIRELSTLRDSDEKIASVVSALEDAEVIVYDVVANLKDYGENLDLSPERLNEVSIRIDEIDSLKRRYSKTGSIEEILKALEEKKERLDKLTDYDSYVSGLKEALKRKEEELLSLCNEVSSLRKEAAVSLSDKITEALEDLNFNGAGVEIRVAPLEKPTSKGMDDVCVYISTNTGERMRPLNEIASGGELSRIMLAIKTIFAESGDVDTLIFDEIDSGISGRAASRVAKRLAALSGDSQVICITHLPQIAAKAGRHFLIEKTLSREGITVSSIKPLSLEEREKEVARMLAGDEINEAALENARVLIGDRR